VAYDQPYVLMGYMGTNIRLHLTVGVLLLAAYLASSRSARPRPTPALPGAWLRRLPIAGGGVHGTIGRTPGGLTCRADPSNDWCQVNPPADLIAADGRTRS
jgi:hypothetical protein